MNSNEKYIEILDEYGTWDNYTAAYKAWANKTHGPPKPSKLATWSDIIKDIIINHDASSSSEILEKLEELYNPPTKS